MRPIRVLTTGSFALVAAMVQTVNAPAFGRRDAVGAQLARTQEFVSYPSVAREARIGGTVRVQLRVASGTVVEAKASDGAFLLIDPARLAALRLRFEDSVSGTFMVAFSYEALAESRGCLQDQNSAITVRLPDEVVTQSTRPETRHYAAKARLRLKRLAGVVRCNCDKGTAGTDVRVVSLGDPGREIRRRVRVDREGRFEFRNLPYGTYQLDIGAAGFLYDMYTIDYNPDAETTEAEFALRLDPCVKVVVDGGEVPFYPPDAQAQRVEGEVLLRYDYSARQVMPVSGPSSLVGAAIDNLRSWRFSAFEAQSLDVKYKFMLRSPECGKSPITHLRLPTEVEVIACTQ